MTKTIIETRGVRVAALLVAVSLLGLSQAPARGDEIFRGDNEAKPYTNVEFQTDPNAFQFAVIGDRTGGGRGGVLTAAVDLLNLLRPELVMGVGDLIEGYTEDEALLRSWWQNVDDELGRLDMPFFFVPGNHDVNIGASEDVWFERVGSDRTYSHFVYKDVLFLLLSTEDPAKVPNAELEEQYERVKSGELSREEAIRQIEEIEKWAGAVSISDAQVAYFEETLKANSDVRWTFVFMHSPAWAQPDLGNFAAIEALLADRPYTVFAGHTHTYDYEWRHGRDYITMGMTGGLAPAHAGTGNMDHVAWVTMTDEGPVVSNLLLNGIVDKRGAVPTLKDFLLYRPRQVTLPGQSLGIATVPNLRDLGGYETGDGSIVASGLLYRSNQLHHISAGDMALIGDLDLEYVYDLRTYDEMRSRPEELPPDVSHVWLDVLADSPQAGPAMLERLMEDPKAANAELGGGKAAQGFAQSYREFVSLPSAQREYRKLFLSLANPEMLPALFHCTTGKDRTGWAAAAFLSLLGVPKDVVMEDYLRSNEYILPMYSAVVEGAVASGIEEEIPLSILGVREEYLEAAFDEMETRYGSIENYFSEAFGIDTDQQEALRELFLFRN